MGLGQLNLWSNLWSRRSEKSTLIRVRSFIPCLLRSEQKLDSDRIFSLILSLKFWTDVEYFPMIDAIGKKAVGVSQGFC